MQIIVDDLQIIKWTVDVLYQYVHVEYRMLTSTDEIYKVGYANFWVTLPAEPTEVDYQLPPSYVPTLSQLTTDARNALLHLIQ